MRLNSRPTEQVKNYFKTAFFFTEEIIYRFWWSPIKRARPSPYANGVPFPRQALSSHPRQGFCLVKVFLSHRLQAGNERGLGQGLLNRWTLQLDLGNTSG